MAESAGQQWGEEELAEITVRCLTLNLHGMNLVLPNTLVAEVTELPTVTAAANTPGWLSGFISWRGRNVPLISYERLLGQGETTRSEETRMVVLNTLNANPRVPFIAMEIQSLPRLSLLKHGMLEYEETEKKTEPVILARMRVEDESVVVPNIDAIERMLVNLGFSA